MDYPRLGLPLALELVNTQFASGGRPCDALLTPADLDEWLQLNAQAVSEPTTEAFLERFRELRAALRRLFTSVDAQTPPLANDVQLVNDVCAAVPHYPQLTWTDKTPRIHFENTADACTAALGEVARSAVELLTRDVVIGQCQAPGCVLFFTRDAHRRHWCSAACGNRARVARHYSRHRRSTETG
jgi:predicted RNA-binding Zn ribbon-like protein